MKTKEKPRFSTRRLSSDMLMAFLHQDLFDFFRNQVFKQR
jgi:hypothetical protein